jgi:hypothetical protein
MDSLKHRQGLPRLTLLRPVDRPSLKRPRGRFRGGLPTGRVPCSRPLPPWTPHAYELMGRDFNALKRGKTMKSINSSVLIQHH